MVGAIFGVAWLRSEEVADASAMVWIIFTLLTAASIFAVLWPLSRAPVATEARELDVAFYRAQEAEIDRDLVRGTIGAGEAEIARAEAARRLLAAASQRTPQDVPSTSRWPVIAVAVGSIVAVPTLALGLYLSVGAPNFADQPLEARLNASPSKMDMATAIAKIEKHLVEHPDDGRGWAVLAPIYMRLDRMDDAVTAFTNELRLLGPTADRYASLGVAQVSAAAGTVSADAKKSFEQAVALDPKSPRGLFYLGLASEQDGDKGTAVEFWRKLVAVSPNGAPWLPTVESHIAAATGREAAPVAADETNAGAKAAAVMAMPGDQQQAMIHRMVDGLANRLKNDGHDIDGWLRLVRAYRVLNEEGKAKIALSDARKSFTTDPAAKKRLDDLAHELGLES